MQSLCCPCLRSPAITAALQHCHCTTDGDLSFLILSNSLLLYIFESFFCLTLLKFFEKSFVFLIFEKKIVISTLALESNYRASEKNSLKCKQIVNIFGFGSVFRYSFGRDNSIIYLCFFPSGIHLWLLLSLLLLPEGGSSLCIFFRLIHLDTNDIPLDQIFSKHRLRFSLKYPFSPNLIILGTFIIFLKFKKIFVLF